MRCLFHHWEQKPTWRIKMLLIGGKKAKNLFRHHHTFSFTFLKCLFEPHMNFPHIRRCHTQKKETKWHPDEWPVISAFTTWCHCRPAVCCAAAALRSAVGQRGIFRFRSTLMHLLAAARPPHNVKWCRHGNSSGAQCDRWSLLPWKHHQLNEDLTGCRFILLNFYNISFFFFYLGL